MSAQNVVFIDNLDSFTFNLVEAFAQLGCAVRVFRNTADASEVFRVAVEERALIVLSPGPGGPEEAGCCLELIAMARGVLPLLGVCLGHQALAQEAGGTVNRANAPVHGKALSLHHDGQGPFAGVANPTAVGRYHSLCTRDLPARFRVHAELDGMAMAFSDPAALQTGLQFHPESILTPDGEAMLANILVAARLALRDQEQDACVAVEV